jgi:hypothetical protein
MAWLKVSFPSVSWGGEALVSRRRARLPAVRFAKRSFRVCFAELFRALDFFIAPSVRIARPNGASIVGAMAPVKRKWQIGRQSRRRRDRRVPPARFCPSDEPGLQPRNQFLRASSKCCPTSTSICASSAPIPEHVVGRRGESGLRGVAHRIW